MIQACEQAVAMRPNWGPAHGSRGLAYALTGNIEGAIKDFKVSRAWWQEKYPDSELPNEMSTWITELETNGEFSKDTLERLRYEQKR